MKVGIRTIAGALATCAIILTLASPNDPQGRARASAPELDWEEIGGEVTYSDGAGCFCSGGDGECAVQFDRHGDNIGSCDDTDTTCGDITSCPH